jgi:hypothetical protein
LPASGRAYAAVEDGTVAEPNPENEPTIVERWLEDQQQWQRTVLAYLDAMTKNDDFLVHLGNAMRGSLLAGKPYPSAAPPGAAAPAPAADAEAVPDERLDKVLFALHQLQGQLTDLQMTLDEMREGRPRSTASASPASRKRKAPRAKASVAGKRAGARKPARRSTAARTTTKNRKPKGRL